MHKRFRLLACRLVALWLMLMFAPTVSAGMITKIEGTYTGIMPPQSQITTIFTLDVGQATMPTELAGGTVDPTVVTLGTDPFVNLMTIDPMGNNNSFPITVADGTVRFLIGTSPGQIVTNQPGMIVIEQSVSLLSVDPGLVSDGLDFSPL